MNFIGFSSFINSARATSPLLRAFRRLSTKQIVYKENGDPAKVLKLVTRELDADRLCPDDVLIKWHAAPVNPADLNQIQGVYPVKPTLPAVGGNEGCGRVEAVGAAVNGFAPGDLVIPSKSGLGTWTNFGIYPAEELYRIVPNERKHPPFEMLSMIQVNPPTAYRMLHDFVRLDAGDLVVQNGGNSAVGRYVIQICRIFGLRSINVVRDRDTIVELKSELKALGASEVFTEEEFGKAVRDIHDARLALNCVGGRSSMNLVRALAHGGFMVTYGGMSKQPIQVPTGPLIFADISLRGFWMSKWYEQAENHEERGRMYEKLLEWIDAGELKAPPTRKHAIDGFADAFASSEQSCKQIFRLCE